MGWDGMGWDGMGWDGMGWGGRPSAGKYYIPNIICSLELLNIMIIYLKKK